MTISDSTTDNYSYDAIYQVTGVGYGSGRNVGYNYDAVGNRMAVSDSVSGTTSYTANSLNQYTNIASQVPLYDNNGNLTNLNGSSYTYDAQNRLLTASTGTNSESFAYDAQNRCVSRTLNGTTTYFLYDGWQLAEELNASGVEQALYVSGANVDELLYKATPANTVFYQHDGLGNTTALSDTNGNLVEHYTYDVFGKPAIFDANNNPLTASAYGNRFLFTGREWLQEVGLYDYQNRVYSADLGRFLQTDPLRFAAGDVNVYRYVGNHVTDEVDLFGLASYTLHIGDHADYVLGSVFAGKHDKEESAYAGKKKSFVNPNKPGASLPGRITNHKDICLKITSITTGKSTIAPLVDVGPGSSSIPYWMPEYQSSHGGESLSINPSKNTDSLLDMTPHTLNELGVPNGEGYNKSKHKYSTYTGDKKSKGEYFNWEAVKCCKKN